MTKLDSADTDDKPDESERLSATVRVQTDIISDNAEVEQAPDGGQPDNAKRVTKWLRARARSGRRPDDADTQSDERDQESVEGDANERSGAAESANADAAEQSKTTKVKFRIRWSRVLVYGVLPTAAMVLAAAAGFLKWQDGSARAEQVARIESVAAAKDSTIALLSYKSDTVEKQLDAAKSTLTGEFKDSYSKLISDVVIPGAKRGHVSITATVPAAASVSATADHAVTLLYVNQSAVVGNEPPTDSASSVRVTLDKVDGRWLISGFDPV
jgi:Mce-associated membrane protein